MHLNAAIALCFDTAFPQKLIIHNTATVVTSCIMVSLGFLFIVLYSLLLGVICVNEVEFEHFNQVRLLEPQEDKVRNWLEQKLKDYYPEIPDRETFPWTEADETPAWLHFVERYARESAAETVETKHCSSKR